MKRILDYFSIDRAVGGSQEWFKNVVMYIGGCAAATACDCCIYLALHRGMEHLYPFDIRRLTKQDYIVRRLQEKEIVVVGNPRVYKALKNELEKVLEQLERIEAGAGVSRDLLDTIELITKTMQGMKDEKSL